MLKVERAVVGLIAAAMLASIAYVLLHGRQGVLAPGLGNPVSVSESNKVLYTYYHSDLSYYEGYSKLEHQLRNRGFRTNRNGFYGPLRRGDEGVVFMPGKWIYDQAKRQMVSVSAQGTTIVHSRFPHQWVNPIQQFQRDLANREKLKSNASLIRRK